MKKKLIALVCALALTFSLAGCVISTPDTVGKIGDFEVSSGLYLLAQYGAYQQAVQLADSDQNTTKVKSFLKETITADSDSGETAVVKDFVADKTLETLQLYAAIEARFDELGGELTEAQQTLADNYAQQLMDQYGDTYTANGIGLETLKTFERIQVKHTLLLNLVYGTGGETPVSDSELTDHLKSSMVELAYLTVPMYNTSTFAFADDTQKEEMLNLATAAMDSYNASIPTGSTAQTSQFTAAATAALSDIYGVLDMDASSANSTVQTELLTSSDLADSFALNDSGDTLLGLAYGEAAAVQYSNYAMMMAVRLDPLQVSTLDSLRSQILSDLKGDELDDALAAYGAQLTNDLDSSAMNKLPASKIDITTSSSNS